MVGAATDPKATGITLHDELIQTQPTTSSSHPMRIYTRSQLLFLSTSPLVQLPPGMPELKDWFGSENEQNLSKKENEPTTPGSARERRFKRDAEDGVETPSRPSFRSTLSQPSQMGNFKHQSLRGGDRDRERDPDKDRERDIRDKEGHERLRHLSDKYDRDRLALPVARNKERDTVPHLNAGSGSRISGQVHVAPGSSRRADAGKKKAGEVSEDWRKGSDPRSSREERTENGRKDRDERDRARSRGRDSSRPRRDPSISRRDREREKDLDRDADDDPRRWRDDGKRDERMAARRVERHMERLKEKEPILEPGDRRWVAAEEREGRTKRTSGRDKKLGSHADDGKDREREKEKEKEPAWMDTYIPPPSSAGILGGKALDGELDGIQAWKKERKEREMKDKGTTPSVQISSTDGVEPAEASTNPLDEIQLFRLLMKREEEKKKIDSHKDSPIRDGTSQSVIVGSSSAGPSDGTSSSTAQTDHHKSSSASQLETRSTSVGHNATSLLSLLGAGDPSGTSVTPETAPDSSKTFSDTSSKLTQMSTQEIEVQDAENCAPNSVPPQFNPPTGSRLLAFGRSSAMAPRPQTMSDPNTNSIIPSSNSTSPNPGGSQPELSQYVSSKLDVIQLSPGFSPFEDNNRASYVADDPRGSGNLPISPDGHRRALAERHASTPSSEHPPFHDTSSSDGGIGYSGSKGSRFAKFFDAKAKEGGTPISKNTNPMGLVSSSPGPGSQRQDQVYNGSYGNTPDPRAMDEIYAMLNSSVQTSQPLHVSNSAPLSNNGGFGLQPPNNHHLFQQQQLHTTRLEPLYESRLDDRNFVPDGMVPGLRSAPSPRNRENPGIYPDNLEEIPFNIQQRIPPQQPRHLDPLYPSGPASIYVQQGSRNPGIPLQQSQYRGGTSPHQQQNHIQNSQRLPPGLANLGGRPPHDPSQFLGMPSLPSSGLHGTLHLNGSSQHQPFNSFPPGGNLGYGGPPIRGPHQLQNLTSHLPIPGLGHPSNHDLRAAGQNQLLSIGGGHRGTGFPNQQGPGQIPPILAMRQQQQQHQQLPPHMMPHLAPPHMQQQGPNSQPAHDLMALLMGGSHRE